MNEPTIISEPQRQVALYLMRNLGIDWYPALDNAAEILALVQEATAQWESGA